jgi:transposase
MAKPYSEDLRERLIAAVEREDLSCREAARRYRVSPASAVRWVQQYRAQGRTTALPMGGDRRSVLKPERVWLLSLIAKQKDLTLMALSARLRAERGVKADASMLWRFFRSEGISFKKNRSRRRAAQS